MARFASVCGPERARLGWKGIKPLVVENSGLYRSLLLKPYAKNVGSIVEVT